MPISLPGAADPFIGGEGGVEIAFGQPDGGEVGQEMGVAHQGGEVGGAGLIGANPGLGIDDRDVTYHPPDALGEAGLGGEHESLEGENSWRRSVVDPIDR